MSKITLETIEISSFIIPHHNQKIQKKNVVPLVANATDLNNDCWTDGPEPPCAPMNTENDPMCTEAIAYPVDCDPNFWVTVPIVGGIDCAKTVPEFTCPPVDPMEETGGINGCQSENFIECSQEPKNCSQVCYV